MGKKILMDFDINFTVQPPVYFLGQQVSGTISICLKESIDVEHLRVRLLGECCTNLMYMAHKSNPDYNHLVEDQEILIDRNKIVLGQEHGDRLTLPSGKSTFDFSFNLPGNGSLPSTFESRSSDGYIRYLITAVLVRPWDVDYVSKRAFTILEEIDVNQPALKVKPPILEGETSVFCHCWNPRSLKLAMSIDRTGYCPGEAILLKVKCTNTSNRILNGLQVKLCRRTQYQAQDHDHIHYKSYYRLTSEKQINIGETFLWADQLIRIPCTSPSINSSNLINVNYELRVSVKVPYGTDFRAVIPIVIGTIPLKQLPQPSEAAPVRPIRTDAFASDSTENTTNFAKCVDGVVHIHKKKSIMGQPNYTPYYPFVRHYHPPLPK